MFGVPPSNSLGQKSKGNKNVVNFFLIFAFSLLVSSSAAAQKIEPTENVPSGLDERAYQELLADKRVLDETREELVMTTKAFNTNCSSVSSQDPAKIQYCREGREFLLSQITRYRSELELYRFAIRKAQSSFPEVVGFEKGTKDSAPVDLRLREPVRKAAAEPKSAADRLKEEIDKAPWPIRAKAAFLISLLLSNSGRHEEALAMIEQARQLVPKDPLVQDALTVIKNEKAAEEARKDPHHEKKLKAKARAAWGLGMYLTDHGEYDQSIRYFKEAREYFSDDTSMEGSLLNQVLSDVRALSPGPPEFPIYQSRAHVILDALEYGNRDWDKSYDYLETAYRADPYNLTVRDAMNYFEALYGGAAREEKK